MPTIEEFTLSRRGKIIVRMELIIFYCGFPISVLGLLGALFYIFDGLFFYLHLANKGVEVLFVSLACFFLTTVMLPSMINEYNEIRVSPEGLGVKVFQFVFRWRLINWEDVLTVRPVKPPVFEDSVWAIMVRKLTPWHGMIGRRYGMSPNSVVILSPDLDRVEELLGFIESHKHG